MFSSLMQRLNERRAAEFELEESADAGFTLIELMVVLLILAILLAIAIPTFLGVTGGANDRAAQSNLNTSLTTAKAAETQQNQTYGTTATGDLITAAILHGKEPSITFQDSGTGVTTPGPVSVYVDVAGNGIVMASYSKSTNKCWFAVDNIAAISGTPVSGNVTADGPYNGSASQTQDVGTAKTPTLAGTYYGKSDVNSGTTGCDAGAPAAAGASWGTKFPG
jgi:type IV pilus assembly protein PilA